ncbi:hypothetical protein [Cystobacter fuscus]|uniref:hypothetical protein n=1 Tax=Cystobacter fuscus TaxID=43 RepID=UPI002B2F9370|nr:hypothetical protein F0U63_27315 [Cystobacter fuscus]
MRSFFSQGLKAVLGATVVSATLGAGAAQATVYDDTHPSWIYSNGWGVVSGGAYADAYNGTLHLTSTPGSVATFTCVNSAAFEIYVTRAFNRGHFEVYLNGVKLGTFDGYSPYTDRQVPLLGGGYYVGYVGNFTLTIKSLDTKNPASANYFVDVDAIEC